MNFGSEIVRDLFGEKREYWHLVTNGIKVVNIAKNENFNLNICYNDTFDTIFFVMNCDENTTIATDIFYDSEVWQGNRFFYADFGLEDILKEFNLELIELTNTIIDKHVKVIETIPVKVRELERERCFNLK